jgi:hypothetical protein
MSPVSARARLAGGERRAHAGDDEIEALAGLLVLVVAARTGMMRWAEGNSCGSSASKNAAACATISLRIASLSTPYACQLPTCTALPITWVNSAERP